MLHNFDFYHLCLILAYFLNNLIHHTLGNYYITSPLISLILLICHIPTTNSKYSMYSYQDLIITLEVRTNSLIHYSLKHQIQLSWQCLIICSTSNCSMYINNSIIFDQLGQPTVESRPVGIIVFAHVRPSVTFQIKLQNKTKKTMFCGSVRVDH